MNEHQDRDHLIGHALNLFPGSAVSVTYTEDEIIHLDVDGVRFTLEIGSDDDAYVFHGIARSFVIPLMNEADDVPATPSTI